MSIDGPILVTGDAGRVGGVGGAVVDILRQCGLPVRALVWRDDGRANVRAIGAEVDLGMTDDGYLLRARLNVTLPGLDREVGIVVAAHQTYPHAKASRGNIDAVINLV